MKETKELNTIEMLIIQSSMSIKQGIKQGVKWIIKYFKELDDDVNFRKPVNKVKDEFPDYKTEPIVEAALKVETAKLRTSRYSLSEIVILEKYIAEKNDNYSTIAKELNRSEKAVKAKMLKLTRGK